MTSYRLSLARCRRLAAGAIGVIATAATAAAFANSYRGLYDWAIGHGHIPPSLAWAWPLLLDAFVAIGELRLLIASIDGAPLFSRAMAWGWLLTLGGLAGSVAGNVGHAPGWETQLTYAVAPLAAAAGLGTGLGLIKMAVRKQRETTRRDRPAGTARDIRPEQPETPPGDRLDIARVMVRDNPRVSINDIRKATRCRQPEARTLRQMALAELNGDRS